MDSGTTPPRRRSIAQRLADDARWAGDRVAYAWIERGAVTRTLTCADLHRRATTLGQGLAARMAPGDRVVLSFAPSLDFVIALFACFHAGMVAVPVPPPRGPAAAGRFARIFADCAPRLALTSRGALDGAATPAVPVLDIDAPDITRGAFPGAEDPAAAGAQDLALIQYTSGSTGDPKGVVLSHANLAAAQEAIVAGFRTTADDRMLTWLPMEHDMGLVGGLLHVWWAGGTTIAMSPSAFTRRPLDWLDAIGRHAVTISGGPNFAYDWCARAAAGRDPGPLALGTWRVAFNGAEPVDAGTLDRFAAAFGRFGFDSSAFYPCYGLAEATLLVAGGEREAPPRRIRVDEARLRGGVLVEDAAGGRILVSSGRVRTGGGARIDDPATGRAVADGSIGEIRVRGDSIAGGYWGRPEATAETFGDTGGDTGGDAGGDAGGVAPGWLRTGDLGALLDGELYVTGRLGETFRVRGRTYHPHEIEAAIARRAGAGRPERTVVTAGDGPGEPVVVVREMRERAPEPHRIDAMLRETRGAVMQDFAIGVDRVLLVAAGSILWTTSGKKRRRATLDAIAARPDLVLAEWQAADHPAGPRRAAAAARLTALAPDIGRDDLERFLVEWVAATIERPADAIDWTTSWSDLGVSSLDAVELVIDIETATGLPVDDTLLWEHPTLDAVLDALQPRIRGRAVG